jgi:large subunit ribosomal protein L7Ae
MMMRLKAPPAIAQFQQTVDKNTFGQLMKLLKKYSPETGKEKKTRLQAEAEVREKSKDGKVGPKPNHIKFGLNHVTNLSEEGKAKLVVMAADCEPIELLVFLPALCRSKNIPFCFVSSKAQLGKLCHMKTATCVALTNVNKEDMSDFNNLQSRFMSDYNNNVELRKHWSGGIMGIKNQHMMAKREKIREIELAKKQQM